MISYPKTIKTLFSANLVDRSAINEIALIYFNGSTTDFYKKRNQIERILKKLNPEIIISGENTLTIHRGYLKP